MSERLRRRLLVVTIAACLLAFGGAYAVASGEPEPEVRAVPAEGPVPLSVSADPLADLGRAQAIPATLVRPPRPRPAPEPAPEPEPEEEDEPEETPVDAPDPEPAPAPAPEPAPAPAPEPQPAPAPEPEQPTFDDSG
jgi:outer membrane biosynthesis protein TonB